MPCGKKTLVKNWDKPRKLRAIKPSKYEQNESSVKQHWRNVIKELELSYKDDKFWNTQRDTVHELVGNKIFTRLIKIFDLPLGTKTYNPPSETSLIPSEHYYTTLPGDQFQSAFTISDTGLAEIEDIIEEEKERAEREDGAEKYEDETESNETTEKTLQSRSKSKSLVGVPSSKSFSRMTSKSLTKSMTIRSKTRKSDINTDDTPARSSDDLDVHASIQVKHLSKKQEKNPFFDMLYCAESETDMIKWNSNYKQKSFEVSASDEFSKRAEIKTKQICHDFYEWWVNLGSLEYKSEIKRPEDIEELFQVWFDEHASRGLVLDPKIMPCVLQSIADYVGVSESSCPQVLQRQIAFDLHAETSPAHTMAFNTCLPQRMKHIPPKNNTKELWGHVKIPEDLRSMACIWDDIEHLTSTKLFYKWLKQHPARPMPPCLAKLDNTQDKKQPFVVPSDFVFREKVSSTNDLALPVSQFAMEVKDVLNKVMNY